MPRIGSVTATMRNLGAAGSPRSGENLTPRWLPPLLLTALAIRLAGGAIANVTADIANYQTVAKILSRGGLLYTQTAGIYPYPPPWSWVERSALWVTSAVGGSFAFWATLLPALGDVGIVWQLSRFSRNDPRPWLIPLLYALNPVAIVITALHGQFDSLPVFFSLLAIGLAHDADPPWCAARAGLALGTGIALKSYPVLLLTPFVVRLPGVRARSAFTAAALAPVGILLLPHVLRDPSAVFREVFAYRGFPDHGWAAVLRLSPVPFGPQSPQGTLTTVIATSRFVFLVAYSLWVWRDIRQRHDGREVSMPGAAAEIFVVFYVVMGAIGSQYMLWALPFLLLYAPAYAVLYTLTSAVALGGFYSYVWPSILYPSRLSVLRPTDQGVNLQWWRLGTAAWWATNACWLVTVLTGQHRPPSTQPHPLEPTRNGSHDPNGPALQ